MATREFAPPPPVQLHNGRLRLRDQLLHAVLHPAAPIVPNGMPLLSRRGLEQYFVSLAMEDPSGLSTRLNNILLALLPLTDGETGRPFEAKLIPRECLPSEPDPELMRAKIAAEQQAQAAQEMARQQQAQQMMAFQQQQMALQQQHMAFQQQQAQQMALQEQQEVQAALRRMREDHDINMIAAQARMNCSGGWRIDASGNRVYKPGYIG
jgi:hypothetical protein